MSKRANGEGNVYQRANGTWEARLDVYPLRGALRFRSVSETRYALNGDLRVAYRVYAHPYHVAHARAAIEFAKVETRSGTRPTLRIADY